MKAKVENYFFVTNGFYMDSSSVTPPAGMGKTFFIDSGKNTKKWNFANYYNIF